MSKEIAALIAKRFIQRRDVKAIQMDHDGGVLRVGDWFPDAKIRDSSPDAPKGFKMKHLIDHVEGTRTYGHYLLDSDNMCRMFAFDIDLKNKGGWYVQQPDWSTMPEDLETHPEAQEHWYKENTIVVDKYENNQIDLWHSRKKAAAPARDWYKYEFKMVAHKLAKNIREIGLPCAVAYSGNKGVHVYGFMEPQQASEVRSAAELVMAMSGEFEAFRGDNFWHHKNPDPITGYQNLSIEIFPKQIELRDGGFGNLMRLPLGKNLKNAQDPTFFLDMTSPIAEFKPHPDPIRLLETGECFE